MNESFASDRRRMSTAGMALLFGILVQLAIVAWSYGRVAQSVVDIADRLGRVELKLDRIEQRGNK